MALLNDAKLALRISSSAYDSEVSDLIDAAQADLTLSGVDPDKIVDTDPLIKRVVLTYVKANFGWDNQDAEKYQQSYNSLKMHLSLSSEYAVVSDDAVS
jgi:uncharacterized phage protein (predicted DNA packaging)